MGVGKSTDEENESEGSGSHTPITMFFDKVLIPYKYVLPNCRPIEWISEFKTKCSVLTGGEK